jgi:formylglycine-generating enzyme required for sulfatase activity
MVYVPEGPFIMGSDLKDIEMVFASASRKYMDVLWVWFERELPKREVNIPGFWIDLLPVTCAQYKRFCDMTGYHPPDYWTDGKIPDGRQDHPVVNVSWEDVLAYCSWAGKRPPYESEWEKAARGTDGRVWPWGNEYLEDRGNIDRGLTAGTKPVGSFPLGASPYGCLDMAGNVFQWTRDICVQYPGYAETEELKKTRQERMQQKGFERVEVFADGVSVKETHPFQFFRTVVRGGAWASCAEYSRAAFRLETASGSSSIGFRCVLGEDPCDQSRDLGQQGRHKESLAAAERSLALSPNYPTALFNAGRALENLGKFQEAATKFRQLVNVWPTDHDSWNRLGICQGIIGEHQRAITSYDAAIYQNPSMTDYWYNKGTAIYELAKTMPRSNLVGIATIAAEAAGCLERAQRLGAEDDQLKNNLAGANRQEEVVTEYLRGKMDRIDVARMLAQLGFARVFPLIQHIWAVIRKYYPDHDFTYKDLRSRGFAIMEASTGLTYLKDWGCVEGVALETFRVIAKKDISEHDPWRNVVSL